MFHACDRCLQIVHRVVPELYKTNHGVLLGELSKALDAMSKKSRCVEDFAHLTLQYRYKSALYHVQYTVLVLHGLNARRGAVYE